MLNAAKFSHIPFFLFVFLILIFSSSVSASLIRFEVPGVVVGPDPDVLGQGMTSFTLNQRSGSLFDWDLDFEAEPIGRDGVGDIVWETYGCGELECGAWVGNGRVVFADGSVSGFGDTWMPYLSSTYDPYETMAAVRDFTLRMNFSFAGDDYELIGEPVRSYPVAVPEPGTAILLALCLLGVALCRRLT